MIEKDILNKIKPGARVKVFERASPFTGLVISRKHGNESGATFTVRSVVAGVSVEKIYPINSPMIKSIEILSSPKKIKKSKLYFVRDMPGKRIRKKLKVGI